MKSISAAACAVATVLLLSISACIDPTDVGSDLLEGDQIGVEFTDTISMETSSFIGDTLTTYSPTTLLSSYLFGQITDPILGKSTASVYTQARLQRTLSGGYESFDFTGATLDSIVLVLVYDSSGYYGDVNQTFGMEVLELDESLNEDETYTSDDSFVTKPISLGSREFVPKYDSLEIINYEANIADTVKVIPHLRITLSPELGQRLLQYDSTIYKNDSTFLSVFKGLHLKPTTQNTGMLSFNVLSAFSGIHVFYTKNAKKEQYVFAFNNYGVTTARYEHDYSGAPVEPYLNDALLGDEYTFVQGMRGIYTKITLPYVENLDNAIINKAELIATVTYLDGDNATIFTPADQLLLFTRDSNGKLKEIDDVRLGLAINGLNEIFGGVLEKGVNGQPSQYKMNLTSHFQQMIKGEEINEIYLVVRFGARRTDRVTLCGAGHATYPLQLKVTYTKL
ncbi:MAG: DUF4270 domain-containing protein [Saprospiraceae bacterium]|jgi:hypothetical protein|nr:DUF4270 domain-containing protein [Saprospiraceae bacterium]